MERPLWMDWGPQSSRCCASHKTWVPTDAFLEIGAAFEVESDPERRKQLYLDLVDEWENVTPGMYLWRNVVTYAYRDGIDWRTGAVARTLFDSLFLTIEG